MTVPPRDPNLRKSEAQVERVMALARDFLKTPTPSTGKRVGARSASPAKRKKQAKAQKSAKENAQPKDDVAVNYASGSTALFKLGGASYESAGVLPSLMSLT